MAGCNLIVREWALATKIPKNKVSVFFWSHIRCKPEWLT